MTSPQAVAAPRFPETRQFLDQIRTRVGKVVVGQDVVVERVLIALLTSGHLLLQGVPGLAKTLLVAAVSKTVDLAFARIQFTIDLLPSDIVGSEILDQKTHEFRTHKGPVFTNLLLADEINRAAPKVQSALLEAMQERRVTIGNTTYPLPAPFLVIATQNPVEQAGTFELPEAQLDRFMLLHRLEYLTAEQEKEVLRRNTQLGVRRDGKGAVARTEFDVLGEQTTGSSE
jgi:MoxR-like ATPase